MLALHCKTVIIESSVAAETTHSVTVTAQALSQGYVGPYVQVVYDSVADHKADFDRNPVCNLLLL